MVQPATAANAQYREKLFDKGGGWNRNADGLGRLMDQVQVFEVEINLEAGREVAREDFFGFLVKALAPRQSSRESLNHLLRLHTGLRSKHQRLANRRQVDCNDDLVRQFGKSARS